ncbi:probable endonuclease 4 [Centruroides vittatus]|uniref:probable endonuclease 4 n=1 Tax=Centruroides vittatus TaxID=120091 RepID=UPI003510B34C
MASSGYNLRAIKQINTGGKVKNVRSKVPTNKKNLNVGEKFSQLEENNNNIKSQELKNSKKRKLEKNNSTKKVIKVERCTEKTSLKSDLNSSVQSDLVKLERKNISKMAGKRPVGRPKSNNLNSANQKLKHKGRSDILTSSVDNACKKTTKSKSKLSTEKQKLKMKSIRPLISKESSVSFVKPGEEKFVGAHVSISGGIYKAVANAISIGAKSFGLFLRSQRQWIGKPLSSEAAKLFQEACKIHNFSSHLIIPHGSYLLNCGSPNQEILDKSRAALIDELKRCEMLGLTLFNFHPGSTCGLISTEECIQKIAESINIAHKQTNNVTTVIENMSKQGNTVGGDFRELRAIIDLVEDKSRIGVCLDTCHAFAAGYNLSNEEGFNEMMSDFETIVGMEYLKAVHLNDSVGKLGCHLDRHENIGRGHIGINGFKLIMNDARFNNLPLILETPANLDDEDEIKILYGLCDM